MDEHGDSRPAVQPAAPTEDGAPAARRPVGRRITRGLVRLSQAALLLVIVSTGLLLGWLYSPDFQRRSITLTEGLLENALGEAVDIRRINVAVWPPGLTAVGVDIAHPATGDTIIAADRLRIPVKLTLAGPRIGVVRLDRPTVHLHVDEDGLREFRSMSRAAPDQRRPLRRLPFAGVNVIDGHLQLDLPDGTVAVSQLQLTSAGGPVTHVSGDLQIDWMGLHERSHFEWSDVVLGPEAIEIPRLTLDLRPISLSGGGVVPLAGEMDVDLTAKVQLEHLDPLFRALPPQFEGSSRRALHGKLDLDAEISGPTADPVARVTALTTALGVDVPGVLTPLLTYEFGNATLSATVARQGIDIERLVLYWGGGELVGWGHITPDKQLVDGHAIGEGVHLAPLLVAFDSAPTPWVDFTADAELVVSGSLQPLSLDADFDFAVADLVVGDRPVADPAVVYMLDIPEAHAKGTVHLNKDTLTLSAPWVRGPASRGSATMDIGLAPRGPLDLRIDLWGADLTDFQPLADVGLKGVGAIRGRIWGPFNRLQFAGDGDIEGFEVLSIPYADRLTATIISPDMRSLQLHDAVARIGSSHYGGRYSIDFKSPMSMSTDIAIPRGRVEDLVGMFIDLEGLSGNLSGNLVLDGPLFEMDGAAHLQLSDVDLFGEQFPIGEGHGYMDGGRFTLDDLRVRRDGGHAGVTLRGSVDQQWALDMELIADGLRLEALDRLEPYDLPLSGRLSIDSRIRNTLFDPSPKGRIWVTDVRYAGEPVAESVVKFETTDGVADIAGKLIGGTANVRGTLGLWDEQPYDLSARLIDLPAHVLYPTAADGSPLRAMVTGDVTLRGHFGETWSPVTLDATLPQVEVRFGHHVLRNDVAWHYAQDGNAFELSDLNLHGPTTHFDLGVISDESLLLLGEGKIDLDLLRAVVPGLDRAAGHATVEMEMTGSPPNVTAAVNVDVFADLLRHDSAPLTFEDATATLKVSTDRIVVSRLRSKLGGGTIVGQGQIEASDWIPTRYDLKVKATDAQVQWVESLPPAIGDASFSFDGPVDALLLSGDIRVTDMTFAERIDWEDWVVEYREYMLVDPASIYDEDPLFNLNVSIDADRTIRLQNNVAEGIASADLRIIGDTNRPGLVGTVTVQHGLAFLQDREFRIDRGHLVFNDPWTWDPQLDFSLMTDIDSREQRYQVDYQVFGPFSDWRTTTRSDPPLPQSDVNALLWFGVTLDELEEMGELSSAVVQGVADLLVADFFVSNQVGDLRGDLPDFLRFDRIDLATGVNVRGDYSPEPRLVVDKRLDDLAGVDLTWELNLMRPDEAYVSAQKRIGGMWSLSGWYATLQRDRVLPIGGAYGVDVTARWEIE